MANVQLLLSNAKGPLPRSEQFTPLADQLFLLSGSAFSNANGIFGWTDDVNDNNIGDNKLYFNQTSTHTTVPDQYIKKSTAAGGASLSYLPLQGTQSDVNDRYNAAILDNVNADVLIDVQHQLPINHSFTTTPGYKLLLVNGSVWTKSANNTCGFEIVLNGNSVATSQMWINPASVHTTMPSQFVVLEITNPQNTLELLPLGSETTTDYNDFYHAVLVDLQSNEEAVTLIDRSGALPLKYGFNNPVAGNKFFMLSGSVFTGTENKICGVNLVIDQGTSNEQVVGTTELWLNQKNQHSTLPTLMATANLSGGTHTISLVASSTDTHSDINDYYSVLMLNVD